MCEHWRCRQYNEHQYTCFQHVCYAIMSCKYYNDVILGAIASQITSLAIVFSTDYLDTDQRKHQSSASLAFVRGIHRRPVKSPHKWPVTRKMFPINDVIMQWIHVIYIPISIPLGHFPGTLGQSCNRLNASEVILESWRCNNINLVQQ